MRLRLSLAKAEHPDGAEFDSSDNNVYFVKAGHMQMRAMDKLLAGRESQGTTVAQAAAAAPTMAATGPLSKVSTVTVVQQNLCKVRVVICCRTYHGCIRASPSLGMLLTTLASCPSLDQLWSIVVAGELKLHGRHSDW